MPIPSIGIFTSAAKSLRTVFVAAVTLGLLTHFASAQQTLGSINGTVMDASGAVVQGAQVKARAVATNLEMTAQSKSDGSFGQRRSHRVGVHSIESELVASVALAA